MEDRPNAVAELIDKAKPDTKQMSYFQERRSLQVKSTVPLGSIREELKMDSVSEEQKGDIQVPVKTEA